MLKGQVLRRIRVAAALVLAAGAGIGAAPPARGSSVTQLLVTGNEFAFSGLPATVPAGELFLAFKNDGKMRHEMSIARLKDGVTPEFAVEQIKTGGRRRDFASGAAALIVAGPGENSGKTRLVFDVHHGETYIVLCTLKDKPDAQPHIMFGMYTSFRVE